MSDLPLLEQWIKANVDTQADLEAITYGNARRVLGRVFAARGR